MVDVVHRVEDHLRGASASALAPPSAGPRPTTSVEKFEPRPRWACRTPEDAERVRQLMTWASCGAPPGSPTGFSTLAQVCNDGQIVVKARYRSASAALSTAAWCSTCRRRAAEASASWDTS